MVVIADVLAMQDDNGKTGIICLVASTPLIFAFRGQGRNGIACWLLVQTFSDVIASFSLLSFGSSLSEVGGVGRSVRSREVNRR